MYQEPASPSPEEEDSGPPADDPEDVVEGEFSEA
jgi:hypothetical protein